MGFTVKGLGIKCMKGSGFGVRWLGVRKLDFGVRVQG